MGRRFRWPRPGPGSSFHGQGHAEDRRAYSNRSLIAKAKAEKEEKNARNRTLSDSFISPRVNLYYPILSHAYLRDTFFTKVKLQSM